MDTLFEQFGGALAAFLDHPVVRTTMLVAVAYTAILWLATAWWVLHDMRRRHRDPALPFVASAGIILASPILFPLALVVYRIVRPGRTLAEAREQELTDRLAAIEAEETLRCPGCELAVEESWLACPACRTRLAHRCLACDRTMGLDWDLCAWCGAEFGAHVSTQALPARLKPGSPEALPAGYRRTVGAAGL
jgi:hypothetical protein